MQNSGTSPSSKWNKSPYLHHALSSGTSEPTDPKDMSRLLEAAFGGVPQTGSALKAYQTIEFALSYYGDVFKAEPSLSETSAKVLRALKAQKARPENEEYLRDLPSDPNKLAVLAIMDEALPFDYRRTKKRLAAFWVQHGAEDDKGPNDDLPFGQELRGGQLADLNRDGRGEGADSTTIVAKKVYRRKRREIRTQEKVTHGAAILGEAVRGSDEHCPLVLVGLPSPAVRDTSGRLLPFFIIAGLLYVMATTRELAKQLNKGNPPRLPMVVNLSFGVLAGPKDGQSPIERVFESLANPDLGLSGLGPMHIVLPMGNGRLAQCIARITAGSSQRLGFHLQPEDKTPTYLEIRAQGEDPLALKIAPPGTERWVPLTDCKPGESIAVAGLRGVQVYKDSELTVSGGQRTSWLLAFPPTVPVAIDGEYTRPGTWKLCFSEGTRKVDLAIQRDDSLFGLASGGRQAHFVDPDYTVHDSAGRIIADDTGNESPVFRTGTVNAFATARHVWRVGGGYRQARRDKNDDLVVPYSGVMPTSKNGEDAWGDILAPCENSRTRSGMLVESMAGGVKLRSSGTSLAVPLVARLLTDNLAKGPQIRDVLKQLVEIEIKRLSEKSLNPKSTLQEY